MAATLKFNKLFNAYNTTLRMLQDRGCEILGPKPVVEALAANPTGQTPVSVALMKKMCRPDSEDSKHLSINRAALTITCTLSTYIMQLTATSKTPLMQVVFVEEERSLSMNAIHQCRDAARKARAQWLLLVADAKITTATRKEIDELNIGWSLLTTPQAASGSTTALTSSNNGIVSDIVEHNVPGLAAPEGAKPRRSAKKAALSDAAAASVQNKFVDENQSIANIIGMAEVDADGEEAKKTKAAAPRPLFVELFEEDDLVFSPLRHSLAPKHRVLTEAETETLLKSKGATLPQLPRIEFTDPISRYFGLQRGAVVHITRAAQSDVVGEHDMYRHVV
eukprot:GILI01018807.1.p1 GENE.GILI01018807.1~~GILI01018807.1.p1  ORF type:complete len:336 (+),score=81.88 GILI01018807.1:42-1049(+)